MKKLEGMSIFDWRFLLLIFLGLFLVMLTGLLQTISAADDDKVQNREIKDMQISLPFDGLIPEKYSRSSENISPAINYSDVPSEAESISVIMDDVDSPGNLDFTHWVIWNIPVNSSIPENLPNNGRLSALEGAVQGQNSYNRIGYSGPDPGTGIHTYRFRIYALDSELDLQPGSSKQQLLEEMEGKIVAKAEARADYSSE